MCPTVYPYSIQLKERFIMPDKEAHTIQELIFYQYTKIITESAMCGKGDLNSAGGWTFWTSTRLSVAATD